MTVTQLADRRTPKRQADQLHRGWTYRWVPDDEVWEVTHTITGLVERFADLNTMVAWANGPTALADLRHAATVTLEAPFVLSWERDRAARALMLLADPPTLLPYTTDPDLIETRCLCGGFLAGPKLIHVDTCVECLHAPDKPCPDDRNTHTVCTRPVPAACDHERCVAPNRVYAQPCLMALERCCGLCCHGGAA